MPDKEIKQVRRIFTLADQHKVVWHGVWRRHIPAAVLQHTSGRLLRDMVRAHQIWTYKTKGKLFDTKQSSML